MTVSQHHAVLFRGIAEQAVLLVEAEGDLAALNFSAPYPLIHFNPLLLSLMPELVRTTVCPRVLLATHGSRRHPHPMNSRFLWNDRKGAKLSSLELACASVCCYVVAFSWRTISRSIAAATSDLSEYGSNAAAQEASLDNADGPSIKVRGTE